MLPFARTLVGAAVLLALALPVRAADLTFSAVRGTQVPPGSIPYLEQKGVLTITVDPALGDTLTSPPSVILRGPLLITATQSGGFFSGDFTNVKMFLGESLVAAGPSLDEARPTGSAPTGGNAGLTLIAPVGGVPVGSPLVLIFSLSDQLTTSTHIVAADVTGRIIGFAGAPPPAPIPEPASLLLVATGLAGVALRSLRR